MSLDFHSYNDDDDDTNPLCFSFSHLVGNSSLDSIQKKQTNKQTISIKSKLTLEKGNLRSQSSVESVKLRSTSAPLLSSTYSA